MYNHPHPDFWDTLNVLQDSERSRRSLAELIGSNQSLCPREHIYQNKNFKKLNFSFCSGSGVTPVVQMAENRFLENLPQRTRDPEQGSRGSRLRFKYVTLLDVAFLSILFSEPQNHGITAFPGHEDLLLSAYFPLLIFSSKRFWPFLVQITRR